MLDAPFGIGLLKTCKSPFFKIYILDTVKIIDTKKAKGNKIPIIFKILKSIISSMYPTVVPSMSGSELKSNLVDSFLM